jgi:hypothetical protein
VGLLFVVSAIAAWAMAGKLELVVDTFFIAALLISTGRYLIRLGRRVKEYPSLEELLTHDARPPVLYLRSFNQESQYFVIGDKSEYGRYAKSFQAVIASSYQKIGIPFEAYLSDALTESIGPFIALGGPEDYLAAEGAVRTYAKDTEWMDLLDQLARRCACIVAEVGKSANLRWEFEHLRHEGLQPKLFVVTQHSHEGSRYQWAFWEFLWRLKGIPSVKWREFAEGLGKLGYDLGFEDPGPGSVVGFDAEGRGILLTAQADQPEEFVVPIQAWLTSKEIVGRHVHIACLCCGRRFHAIPSPGGGRERFCQECDEGLTTAERRCRGLKNVFSGLFGGAIAILTMWAPEGSWVGGHPGATIIATVIAVVAIYNLVAPSYRRRIAQRVVSRYRRLADTGDAIAMCRLAEIYRAGRKGLPKDTARAVDWYRKAAEAGDAVAMFSLGTLYDTGQGGLPKDESEAAHWYQKAANLGSAVAQENLERLQRGPE